MDINLLSNNTPIISILNLINSPIVLGNNNILQMSFDDQGDQKHPTDKDFIKTLEKTTFTEDQEDVSCGICLDTFKEGDSAYILPCSGTKHYFHIGEDEEECGGILPWLKENNTCPICREIFPEEEVEEEPVEEEVQGEEVDESIPVPQENFDEIEDSVDEEYDVDNQEEVNNNISDFLEDINIDESPSADDLLNELSNIINRTTINTRRNILLPQINTTVRPNILNIIGEIQQEIHEEIEDYELQQAIQRSINER